MKSMTSHQDCSVKLQTNIKNQHNLFILTEYPQFLNNHMAGKKCYISFEIKKLRNRLLGDSKVLRLYNPLFLQPSLLISQSFESMDNPQSQPVYLYFLKYTLSRFITIKLSLSDFSLKTTLHATCNSSLNKQLLKIQLHIKLD